MVESRRRRRPGSSVLVTTTTAVLLLHTSWTSAAPSSSSAPSPNTCLPPRPLHQGAFLSPRTPFRWGSKSRSNSDSTQTKPSEDAFCSTCNFMAASVSFSPTLVLPASRTDDVTSPHAAPADPPADFAPPISPPGTNLMKGGKGSIGSSKNSNARSKGPKPGLLYVLQGVRDRETIRGSSEAEADRAVAVVGLKGKSNAPLSSLERAKARMPRLEERVAEEVEGSVGETGWGNQDEDEGAGTVRMGYREGDVAEEEGTEEAGPPLPYLPSQAEDLEAKIAEAETASNSLEILSKAVNERMLEEKFDNVRAPYREPREPKPLPYQLDLLTYYAKEALRKRNVPEAARIYQRCMELDRYDGRAYIGLARIEGRRRNGTAAQAVYEEALRWCADNPFVLQAYGVFQQRNGNLRKAMELFDAAIRHGPKHSAAWLGKAQLLWELGRKREARGYFQTAVQSNPENEVLWHAWGVAERREGNFGVARKLLRKATEINPRNSFCWHAWAVMEQELENMDLAVDLYQNALKAFPNSSHTYQAWACLEKDRGNWELAFSLFRSGIAKRPWDGGAYQPYALALKERGEMTAAMEIFQKGLQEDPYHCPLYQAFGMLLAELGRTDAARSIFERGTQTNPRGRHVYYIWHAWAVMEEKSGNFELARRYFRKALERQSRSVPTLVALAQLEEMEGNVEGCRELYERVLLIRPEAEIYWTQYEVMERRFGHVEHAMRIEQRRHLAFGGKSGGGPHGGGGGTRDAKQGGRGVEGYDKGSRMMGLFDSFQEVYALPRGTMEEEKGRGRIWGPLGGKDRAKRSVGWRADGQNKGREADEEQEEAEHSREQPQRGRIGGSATGVFPPPSPRRALEDAPVFDTFLEGGFTREGETGQLHGNVTLGIA